MPVSFSNLTRVPGITGTVCGVYRVHARPCTRRHVEPIKQVPGIDWNIDTFYHNEHAHWKQSGRKLYLFKSVYKPISISLSQCRCCMLAMAMCISRAPARLTDAPNTWQPCLMDTAHAHNQATSVCIHNHATAGALIVCGSVGDTRAITRCGSVCYTCLFDHFECRNAVLWHAGTGKSIIWQAKNGTTKEKQGDQTGLEASGCLVLQGDHTYYRGHDEDSCRQDTGLCDSKRKFIHGDWI